MCLGLINRSAVKDYALRCSEECRAGKFTRVSEEFLAGVENSLDDVIRQVLTKLGKLRFDSVPPNPDFRGLTSREAKEKMAERLDEVVRRIIQLKVEATPSCGVTL